MQKIKLVFNVNEPTANLATHYCALATTDITHNQIHSHIHTNSGRTMGKAAENCVCLWGGNSAHCAQFVRVLGFVYTHLNCTWALGRNFHINETHIHTHTQCWYNKPQRTPAPASQHNQTYKRSHTKKNTIHSKCTSASRARHVFKSTSKS